MDIETVNGLPEDEFITVLSNIVEHFEACARHLEKLRPFTDCESVVQSASNFLSQLSCEDVKRVLRLHPDLVGRFANVSLLSAESQTEQQVAGLREISTEDTSTLSILNQRYKDKFSFPFIICVRENKFEAILNGLQTRLNNSTEEELQQALEEVKKITKHRIQQIIQ